MTTSTGAHLKGIYNTARTMGDKAISSDAALEIIGFENMWMLTKQFPWPQLSVGSEIEVPAPMGMSTVQPGQVKIYQQGPITLFETKAGHVDNMLLNLIANGGRFDAKVYAGTPTAYSSVKPIVDCFIMFDSPDRDWENRTQVLTISGTLHYHYFGETLPGNI